MTTIAEIQEAIGKLHFKDKQLLSAWLSSQEQPEMREEEEAALLASLDRAARQLDAGEGVSAEQAHGMVRQWVSK